MVDNGKSTRVYWHRCMRYSCKRPRGHISGQKFDYYFEIKPEKEVVKMMKFKRAFSDNSFVMDNSFAFNKTSDDLPLLYS